ncbi:MAG: GAF domain-containing SpoIIE family protein phosphatase, partial [Candidatus Aegiribacteria sp.]
MKPLAGSVRVRAVLTVAALLLFLPLFFFRTSPGVPDIPETCACLGALLLYLFLIRLISRLQLTSVLVSAMVFTAAVFGLTMYLQPAPPPSPESAEPLSAQLPEFGSSSSGGTDSSRTPDSPDIQSRIDSLATSGGRAIRNVGLFDAEGTLGMTLGTLGEMTSATAEVFIRTVYAGSNVFGEDSVAYSEEMRSESLHPLKVLALVAAVLFSVSILASIRYLVLVERKKRTLLWFRVMLVVLALRIVYISTGQEGLLHPAVASIGDPDVILSISPLYVLLILFAFINAFRTEWIHYLNRWRKYLALAGSLGVTILSQSVLRVYFSGGITVCSLALGTLIGCVFTVLLIFSSVAFVKILFLLPSARLVDRRLNQLRIIEGLSQSIYSTFDEDRIMHSSVTMGRRFTGADRCWAVKIEGGKFIPWQSTVRGDPRLLFPREWHREVLDRLERSGTLLYNRYPSSPPARLAAHDSPVPGSLVASLIRIRKKTFGILYTSTQRQFGFVSETRALVETFARQVAAAVDNAGMMETELERERYREELAIARSIQESLLPGELPEVQGMDIAGISVPSRQVGGDYYDVFSLSGGLYGIAIADVAGKGTAAALLMAGLQSALYAIAPTLGRKAGGTVERLNSVMSRRMPDDKFITFFYAVLDPSRGTLDYCCAGHDPPIHVNGKGNVRRLDEGGLVLGVHSEASYTTSSMELAGGDRLMLFTDGVTESMKKDTEEEFGTERLVDFLASRDELRRHVGDHPLDRLLVRQCRAELLPGLGP